MNWLDLTLIVLAALAVFTALGVLAWECLAARPPMPRPIHHVTKSAPRDWEWPPRPPESTPLHTPRRSQAHPHLRAVSDKTDAA